MHFVVTCDSTISIDPVINQLKQQNIAYQLKQGDQYQELWVADMSMVPAIREYYLAYVKSQQSSLNLTNLKLVPVTAFILLVTLIVALMTQLGTEHNEWFLVAKMQYDPRDWFFYEGYLAIWHSLSPIFLHFSIEHLIFNFIGFWYLGNLIERALGKVFFTVLLLCLALAGNFSQLMMSGPLFGGLSGVVYGLIGFGFVYQMTIANLNLPKGLFYLAGIWLLFGVSNIFSAMGLFNMANAAHVGGLVAGLVMSIVYLLWKKLRVKNEY